MGGGEAGVGEREGRRWVRVVGMPCLLSGGRLDSARKCVFILNVFLVFLSALHSLCSFVAVGILYCL